MKIKNVMVVVAVFLLAASVVSPAALAADKPHTIYGYVSINGVRTDGLQVVLSGGDSQQTTTLSGGYYQITTIVGISVTVTASDGNGHSASASFTTPDTAQSEHDLAISVPVATATPTPTPTATATATPTSSYSGQVNNPGPSSTVQGTVYYGGVPAYGAKVVSNKGDFSVTDYNGFYMLKNLAAGASYTLTATYKDGMLTQVVSTPINGGVVNLNFNLSAATSGATNNSSSIAGTFTTVMGGVTYNGTAAAGATVSGNGVMGFTDSNGSFTLRNVDAGVTFNLTVTYHDMIKTVTVTTPGDGSALIVNVDMPPAATPTPTPTPEATSLQSPLIWFLLLVIVAIAVVFSYFLYSWHK